MKRVRDNELDYLDDGLHYHADVLFTGLAFHVESGCIVSEEEYRDGLLWGLSRTWHETGEPESEAMCVAGLLHGLRSEWDTAGGLIEHEVFEHGVCLWRRRWDEDGKLVEEYRLAETDTDYGTLTILRRNALEEMRELGGRSAEPKVTPDCGGIT